jgi:hypothetical protein
MSTNKSQSKNFSLLNGVFKLNFRRFLVDDLNESNFVEYQPLVMDIFDYLEKEENNKQSRALLESTSDKLLDYCLKHMFDTSENEWSLKYMRTCLPHACNNTHRLNAMLNAFAYHFVMINRIDLEKKLKLPDFIDRLLKLNANGDDSHGSESSSFDSKKVSFLRSYFGVVIKAFETALKQHLNSIDQSQSDETSPLQQTVLTARFLIEFSLFALYDIDDNASGASQLCIDCLTDLASIGSNVRGFVLKSSFARLESLIVEENEASREAPERGFSEKKRQETFIQDKSLCLLVALADQVMDPSSRLNDAEKRIDCIEYLRKREYWRHIQSGLAHTNSLTRKRALYLLKRAADLAVSSDQDGCYSLRQETAASDGSKSTSERRCVLLYDSTPSAIWNDFFLCIELLEETSVHIIKPSLTKFFSLIEAINKGQLHFSWLLVLLRRAFNHESKYVVRWTLNAFFECGVHSLLSSFDIQESDTQNREKIVPQEALDVVSFFFFLV